MTAATTAATGAMTAAMTAATGAMTAATGAMTGKTGVVAALGCSGSRDLDDQGDRAVVRAAGARAARQRWRSWRTCSRGSRRKHIDRDCPGGAGASVLG
jgi:hypothetical protein